MDVKTGKFHKAYLSSLEASREVAEDILPYWNSLKLDETIVSQMELCLVEVVNNVYEHSYLNTEGKKFEATSFLSANNELIIEISDFGQSMPDGLLDDLLSTDFVEPVADDPETWLVSRRGLKIVKELSDKLEYFTQQNRNTLRMQRSAK
ncbi:ATP-binding protein [Shewanella youngdeokensis]|uniref:ATP-binding protein n=1 Tax=Shewanella youngdeokensis TaxID=2999068 RepID=A0ABZ0K007_9GAMM|nr:ATP-binding protein [Shewanella sp. DAU334]